MKLFVVFLAVAAWAAARPAGAADFADVFKLVKPSVVYIVSALPDGAASGTGFILSSDASKSEIVTANHVIEGASVIDVILDSDKSKRYHATVLQRDHVRDVAVLEIPVGGRRALRMLASASVAEGMGIAVVGYPRVAKAFERMDGDDLRPSVHTGVVSAIRLDGAMYQFDAVTDHGDSGGPVVDMKTGAVLGIVRGAVLDPSYLARGLELPLPGSAFAMSGKSIAATARGEALPVAAAGAAPKALTSTSSEFRVGFVHQQFSNAVQQNIGDQLSSRVSTDFKADNAFYMVPASVGTDDLAGGRLPAKCDDLRVNAIVAPVVAWQQTGDVSVLPYLGRIDTRKMTVAVRFLALDCSGDQLFTVLKRKSEGLRTPYDREVVDMANDLIDQAQKDFATFRAEHAGAWANLLKTGVFLDPADKTRHALMSFEKGKDGHWRVRSVYRGGPGDVAGVKPGDQIQSINGQNLDQVGAIDGMFDAESVALVIARPSGSVSITVVPRQYDALMKMTGH